MGKKKITTVAEEDKISPEVEVTAAVDGDVAVDGEADADLESDQKKKKSPKASRGKAYIAARGSVDRTKQYAVAEAVALAKKTHTGSFVGTLEAHLVVKDQNISVEVRYPHATGQTKTVAIATDELLEQISEGKIEFDVLIAHPSMMPKLAKHARVLGPKGLMPNPKNGTVSPDPEKRKIELESGTITVRTEKKAPLMHAVVGKLSLDDQQLTENLSALIASLPTGKLVRCTISSTMGPGIRVKVS